MSMNMYLSKDALEKLLGCFEAAAYVGASGARADATWMLRRQLKGIFVIAAEHCRPSLDLMLNPVLVQKIIQPTPHRSIALFCCMSHP
jgi:hypothetical protein